MAPGWHRPYFAAVFVVPHRGMLSLSCLCQKSHKIAASPDRMAAAFLLDQQFLDYAGSDGGVLTVFQIVNWYPRKSAQG